MRIDNPARRSVLLRALIGIGVATVGGTNRAHARRGIVDVPYVPTPDAVVEAMLKLAAPNSQDYVIDLGCGDGRIPIAAARLYGAHGLGVDLSADRIGEARANALKAGVSGMVEFVRGDLFQTVFSKATVLTLYLLPHINLRLRADILALQPGARIVSHAYHMEDWEPDQKEQLGSRTIYLWIVPAKGDGRWQGQIDGRGLELSISQKFQNISGTARVDGRILPISNGKLNGRDIRFFIGATEADPQGRWLHGRIEAQRMAGDQWHVTRG